MSLFDTLVADADVHVLGSAPGASLPPSDRAALLVAVNGSFLPWPDLVPDILILNGHTVISDNPAQRLTRDLLRDRRAGHVVAIANLAGLEAFRALGLGWGSVEVIDKAQRQRACERATGLRFRGDSGDRIPSTGVTALCLAILGGARRLSFSGIGLADGYSYVPGAFVRKHVEVDRRALQALAQGDRGIVPTPIDRP